jgi:hypothetical protein
MRELPAASEFAGHRIEAVAGRGGMGVVYRARQLSLDRIVALKVIAPALTEDAATRRRFLRESRVAASIEHPNVLPIYYTGEEGDIAYIAMRYVPGDDLRTLVRRDGPLAPERAARIAAQVGAALDAAHAAGLVHRDVKPANVLLGADDHVYLTDFGLTKHAFSEADATRSGQWVGTVDFVAPEQIRGERVDARADVYGLGCLLYYTLAGRPPFARDTDEAKLWAHLSEPPPEAGLPALDAVIARALAKTPDARYRSAGDLGRAALVAAGAGDGNGGEQMVAIGAAAPDEADTLTAAARRDARSRRWPTIALAVVAACAGALAIAGLTLLGDDAPRAKPTPTATPRMTSVRLGGRVSTVATGGGRIWAGAFQHTRLDAVSPATARRIRHLRPEIGTGLDGLASAGGTLWAAVSRDRRLIRMDARTGRRTGAVIPLSGAVNGLEAQPGSAWLVCADADAPTDVLLRYDARTGAVRERYRVLKGVRRVATAAGGVWLLASDPARLVRIDLRSGRRRKLALDADRSVDMVAGHGSMWVTLADADELARVDLATLAVLTIAVGHNPAGVALQGGSAWVANRDSSTLSRVDVRSNRVRGEIEVPLNPYELAPDGDALWVTSLAEGKLTRVTAPVG